MKMKVDCKSYTAAVGFTDSSRTGELSDQPSPGSSARVQRIYLAPLEM